MTNYLDFLVSRLFVRNDFSSSEELLEAIGRVNNNHQHSWRDTKQAFNSIAQLAPMANDWYCVSLSKVPEFVRQEVLAYEAAFPTHHRCTTLMNPATT
jgi:hypothetical protein